MAQQFIMGQGSIDLTVKSEKKQYGYELEFEINNLDSDNHNTSLTDIDRIGAAWINDNIGGCTLVNPIDTESIQALHAVNAKIWYMSLSGKDGNCEPTLINLAKELFLAMAALFESHGNLKIHRVVIRSGSSYIVCTKETVAPEEAHKWLPMHYDVIKKYVEDKSTVIYTENK